MTARAVRDPDLGLAEAWGGYRSMIPHIVEWPQGRTEGSALCGKHILDVKVFALGSAAGARVTMCAGCKRRLQKRREKARPTAPVIPIRANRNRRKTP